MLNSFDNKTMIYIQIANMLCDNILKGILLEEEQVPSTNELAKMYSINPATAGKGLNILVDKGILYKKRGIGMFVATGSREKIINERKDEFMNNFIKKMLIEAKNLGISKEELYKMIDNIKE